VAVDTTKAMPVSRAGVAGFTTKKCSRSKTPSSSSRTRTITT